MYHCVNTGSGLKSSHHVIKYSEPVLTHCDQSRLFFPGAGADKNLNGFGTLDKSRSQSRFQDLTHWRQSQSTVRGVVVQWSVSLPQDSPSRVRISALGGLRGGRSHSNNVFLKTRPRWAVKNIPFYLLHNIVVVVHGPVVLLENVLQDNLHVPGNNRGHNSR